MEKTALLTLEIALIVFGILVLLVVWHHDTKDEKKKKMVESCKMGMIRGSLTGLLTGGIVGAVVTGTTLGIINPFIAGMEESK